MSSDLFKLQREIPDRFQQLYMLLHNKLDADDEPVSFEGIVDDHSGDSVACDFNDTLLLMLSEKEAEIEAVSTILSNLRERRARLEHQRDRVRETLLSLLRISGRDKISSAFGTTYSISVPNGKFEVDDEAAFAAANPVYAKIKIEIDRKKVLDDLKEGVVIDGIRVMDRDSVGVRR